jgi:FMN phosphatase YigB (HAD superfamily)
MGLQAVFLDIGGTLGERDATTGTFVAYPSSAALLRSLRDVMRLRIGIITTLGPLSNPQGIEILQNASLLQFIDGSGFVSEHDNDGIAKPDPSIYRHAAARFGLQPEDCLFLGENLLEIIGALTAGMKAVLKPSPPGRELPA